MAAEKPLHRQMVDFCKYHLGKDCFAPFTGQDVATWNAFVYLLQCYSHGGGNVALDALTATIHAAQPTEPVLRVFVQAIPGVLDWPAVARLWPTIAAGLVVRGGPIAGVADVREMFAVERSEVYRGNSNGLKITVTQWGWRGLTIARAAGGSP